MTPGGREDDDAAGPPGAGRRHRRARWRAGSHALVGAAAALLGCLAGTARGASAQEVAFSPRPERVEERRLQDFLRQGGYSLWTRDTVMAADDTVAGGLLVLEATVRLAGRVEGDVWVLGGDLFLRPGSRVTGEAAVLGGGYYASSLARVAGGVTYRPNLLLRAVPREGGWDIVHVGQPRRALDLHGLSGFHAPLYRRVAGWTFGWGGRARAVGLPWQPEVDAAVRFHTVGTKQLEGTVVQQWHPAGDLRFGLEAERVVKSNDAWIKRDILNTLSYLLAGDDFRDYYRSERASLRVGWAPSEGPHAALSLNWEEAESVEARQLGVLLDDDADVRLNPAVDDGRAWSLEATLGYRHRRAEERLRAEARVEAADSTVAGDFSFLMAEARVSWRRPGPGRHRLEVFGIARYDVAGTLPGQRWSSLGGDGTLPTLDELELRGPRMFYLGATYLVPIEPLRVAVLGVPRLFLRNAVGTAWRGEDDFEVEDNVVAGIRFLFLEAGVALDPTRSDLDPEGVLTGSLPAGVWR